MSLEHLKHKVRKGLTEEQLDYIDEAITHYWIAALWSTTDESTPQGGEPLDDNYTPDDIVKKHRPKADTEVADFVKEQWDLLQADGVTAEMCGHDFWLTRNGHGAGFWCRDLEHGRELTDAAHKCGELNPYVFRKKVYIY